MVMVMVMWTRGTDESLTIFFRNPGFIFCGTVAPGFILWNSGRGFKKNGQAFVRSVTVTVTVPHRHGGTENIKKNHRETEFRTDPFSSLLAVD
jgi:hypothetical protein